MSRTLVTPIVLRAALALAVAVAALVAAGSASATRAVAQETAYVDCGNNGRMNVVLPSDITTRLRSELVHVRVDLFRWTGGRWTRDVVGNRRYTNIATSSGQIYGSWWLQSSTGGVRASGFFQHGFTINQPGHYRAALSIVWQRSGRSAYEWVDRHIPDDGWGGILSEPAKFCTYA
jgi:hypothetical protein